MADVRFTRRHSAAMSRQRPRYITLVITTILVVTTSFGVVGSSRAIFVDHTDTTGSVFGAAPSFEERTYYLHDDPTPPVGDTTARLLLHADPQVPTAQSLYNYSSDLDTDTGRHLDAAGYDKNRTDPARAVAWRLPRATADHHLVGSIAVDYWVAQDGFTNADQTKVKWFLRDFDRSSATYTEIAEVEFQQEPLGSPGAWVHVVTTFPDIDHLLRAGHLIEVKAEAGNVNANLAYDTAAYPSFIVFPEAHDVAVTSLDVTTPFGVGEFVTVHADVENQGSNDAEFDLVLTDLTSGQVIDTVPTSLAVLETDTVELTWDSTGATLGQHVLQVEAVIASDIDPTDNALTQNTEVRLAEHDIALSNLSAPSTVAQGAPLDLTIDVENKGNLTETFDLVLTDTTTGSELGRQEMIVGIGVKVEAGFLWDTAGEQLGDHILEVEAVIAGDTNPGDNIKTKTVELKAVSHDLRVAAMNAPSPVGVGEQVPVDVQVENNSNIATTFDLVLRDTTTGLFIETQSVSLARAETAWFAFAWDTAGEQLGDHILEVEAVIAGDTNPGDNIKTKTVELKAVSHDLRVAAMERTKPGRGRRTSTRRCPSGEQEQHRHHVRSGSARHHHRIGHRDPVGEPRSGGDGLVRLCLGYGG